MAISNEEAKLNILDNIAQILIYFFSDEEMSDEEIQRTMNDCEDIAGLIMMSLNLSVTSVVSNNKFKVEITREEPIEFIKSLAQRSIVGE